MTEGDTNIFTMKIMKIMKVLLRCDERRRAAATPPDGR